MRLPSDQDRTISNSLVVRRSDLPLSPPPPRRWWTWAPRRMPPIPTRQQGEPFSRTHTAQGERTTMGACGRGRRRRTPKSRRQRKRVWFTRYSAAEWHRRLAIRPRARASWLRIVLCPTASSMPRSLPLSLRRSWGPAFPGGPTGRQLRPHRAQRQPARRSQVRRQPPMEWLRNRRKRQRLLFLPRRRVRPN